VAYGLNGFHGFKISDEAFQYLAIQQGGINDLAGNREEWARAYHAAIVATYQNIAPHLPRNVGRALDIGSGLGGIDVLISRHYRGKTEICPIDGVDDQPVVNSHSMTFNSERVTRDFLKANRVRQVSYYASNALPTPMPARLVVSFASWCFHYPPGTYLSFVKRCLVPGGTLIVDVRREKPKWRAILDEAFSEGVPIHNGKKFVRMVYAG